MNIHFSGGRAAQEGFAVISAQTVVVFGGRNCKPIQPGCSRALLLALSDPVGPACWDCVAPRGGGDGGGGQNYDVGFKKLMVSGRLQAFPE